MRERGRAVSKETKSYGVTKSKVIEHSVLLPSTELSADCMETADGFCHSCITLR